MLPVVMALLALVTVSRDAQAFYNLSTGRWLNRDPIGEPGFEVLDGRRPSLRAGGSNRYLFVDNSPLNHIDYLGTLCWEPCGLAKAMGLDRGDYGGVICCAGRQYACVWTPGGRFGSSYPPHIRDMLAECQRQHEENHIRGNQIECGCSPYPSRPPYKDPSRKPEFECAAFREQLGCMQSARASCNGAFDCELLMDIEIRLVEQRIADTCHKGPGPQKRF